MSILNDPGDYDEAAAIAFDEMARRAFGPFEQFKWRQLAAEARARCEAAHAPVIEFAWTAPREFKANGKWLPWPGRGLALAWGALAAEQLGLPMPPVQHVFNARRSDACALQALARAAAAVRPHCEPLADVIAALGTTDGRVVRKRPLGASVRCSSPVLERVTLT